MDKSTIMPYQRNYIEVQSIQTIKKPKTNINKTIILLHTITFLLARASILHGLTPFGIAFYTALIKKDRKYNILAITTYIGIASAQGITSSIPYGFTIIIIYSLFQYILDTKNIKILKTSLIGATAYLATTALFLSFGGFYLYDWIIIIFEGIIIFAVTYISQYAISVALENTNRKILSTEETISIAIITALALSGIKEIYILDLSITNILVILTTILFAYNGGIAIGATVGITLGLITSISTGSTPVTIAIFGFSGLLAGTFKDIGKIGSAFGFLIGNTILTFYINGYYEIFIQFKETIIAFIIFLILPTTVITHTEKFCNIKTSILNLNKSHSDRTKKLTYQKLKQYELAFKELATTFEKTSEKQQFFETEDLSKLVERVANKACYNCGMKRRCWDQNFNETYQGILNMLLHIEETGSLKQEVFSKTMHKRCIRPKIIMENIAYLYEINHLNITWKQKLIENRQLVGEQIKGVAKTLNELATNIREQIKFDIDLEEAIYVELDKADIQAKNIMAYKNDKGKLEIVVDSKFNFSHETSKDKFVKIISEAVNTKLKLKTYNSGIINEKGEYTFTLTEAEKYAALTKTATAPKEQGELLGDSYTFTDLKNGQYIVALSDGMGAGDNAHMQSSIAIDMLEKMLEADFNKEVAIKTINSMLLLKSTDEIFTSLDIALLDLYKGRVNFIKAGSAPSFIKRTSGKIEVITTSSLPVGILTSIQIEQNIKKLEDGDIIITVSDGIIDSNKKQNEKWLIKYLQNNNSLNPQQIADGILHTALKFTQNIAKDDMTVLATKVWKV